ncbi:MAG: ATP-binding protein [Desulfobacterales bacterium]|nr:ATP-binding protein [Desulfobacterales bacterium]
MTTDYNENDHAWIRELTDYPQTLAAHLDFFEDTGQIEIPEDPIERVVFQDRAKAAIRKIAQNKGHILMVGRPGTGKSLLANMFQEVLERSMGDYLRPKQAIVAYPGKDRNHIRIAYEDPAGIDPMVEELNREIDEAAESVDEFSLDEQIASVQRVKKWLLAATVVTGGAGFFFPPAFIATGLTGIGAIFMYMQENNHRAQEKIQQQAMGGKKNAVKNLYDMVPEILYDPRRDTELMARVSEPDARNMKGGFRHDPYQSGNLQTPTHKRAFLGAHAKSPIIYIDELKTLVKVGYMPDLLEIMQNKRYMLEGGRNTGSGAADRSENHLRADNIIVACCNHDTLAYLQQEGDGAFLSRIEDKGEIIQMESAVPETAETVRQVAQYIKQEIDHLSDDLTQIWGDVIAKEGHDGVRKRSEHIFGRPLPKDYILEAREFSKAAVLEIVKELRCRASDGKLSSILRPINGIVKTAEFEAILDNSKQVFPHHVRSALEEHLSLEGAMSRESAAHKRDLKKYIGAMTDSIGYVVGLAVIQASSSGQMHGQPLPIHCQINAGGADVVIAPGKIGDIAKAAAQNVRASIKKVLKKIDAPYVGYEMHVEYIQAHGGVEGDSASVAMDIGLISDFIKQPVNQTFGVTGSLTGNIMLPVGGVTEKIRSIMAPDLGMAGACVPWQNKHDVEPLLVNAEFDFVLEGSIPGIRIYRDDDRQAPFDIFFCKTKYHAYRILMGLDRETVEQRMAERSRMDSASIRLEKAGPQPALPASPGPDAEPIENPERFHPQN